MDGQRALRNSAIFDLRRARVRRDISVCGHVRAGLLAAINAAKMQVSQCIKVK